MTPCPVRASRREEVDGFRCRNLFHVLGFEAEQLHPRNDLLFQIRVVQLARNDLAVGDVARWRDRELQDQLALQLRLLAQLAAVESIDCTLVAVEDQLDLLAGARGLAAVTRSRGSPGIEAAPGDLRS